MRALIRLAIMIYPRRWRDRYAPELEALLDDLGPSWRALANVLGGAMFMRLTRPTAITAACVATIALASGLFFFTRRAHVSYVSSADIVMAGSPTAVERSKLERLRAAKIRGVSAVAAERIITSRHLYGYTETMPDADVRFLVKRFRRAVTVVVLRPDIFQIQFKDDDPQTSRQVALDVTAYYARALEPYGVAFVEANDTVGGPRSMSPLPYICTAGGGVMGLLLGAWLARSRNVPTEPMPA